MKRILLGLIAAVLVVGVIVAYDRSHRRVLIPGDRPVSETQLREELEREGYVNVAVMRSGGYFEVSALKEGKPARLSVDAETGRLANEPFHDADEQD